MPLLLGTDAIARPSSGREPGQQLYELGQYSDALSWLQSELQQHRKTGDRLGEAATLSNLALVYSELGQWESANQAIQASQTILSQHSGGQPQELLAQVLNTQGQLQLQQGQAEAALETWQRAETLFAAVDHLDGQLRSQMNQAQALQHLGFYRRSLIVLTDGMKEIQADAESLEKATGLRSLGVALREAGDANQAETTLQQSLAIAQRLDDGEAIAQSLIALGNVDALQGNYKQALAHYEQASSQTALPSTQLNAQLNGLRSQLDLKQWEQAHRLWPSLAEQIANSPPTSNTVQAQLNLAQSLQQLRKASPRSSLQPLVVAQLLSETQRNAKTLGDRRLESYALGKLGALYEEVKQYDDAQRLTQQALKLVDVQSTGEVAYQWQWQLGRIAKSQGEMTKAIAFYESAVNVLGGLRQDLVSSNPDVQFSFQDRVEPLYREYVSLLLSAPDPSPEDLEQARQAIESLQLAELDNFFRAACLDVTPVIVDQVDPSAAVIYPILLQDKLAVVVRLPGEPLKLYLAPIKQSQVEWTAEALRRSLEQPNNFRYLKLSQQLYDWLLRPAMADIKSSRVETLVFIPDGVLRNIPLGVLHDGDRFVIEDYAVALTPGLQLLQAGEGRRRRAQVLVAGLSKAQGPFSDLIHVESEISGINRNFRGRVFLNQGFTQRNLEKAIEARQFPIMHLATHGQFSSNIEDTFLLAWDGEKINIEKLRRVLKNTELKYQSSLELLVLSACETALGDSLAILGLAGIAARSGAKSTLASLWRVNDQSTSLLMEEFYKNISKPSFNKVSALREAQLSIMKRGGWNHPYYWAAFVLVGRWQ